MVMPTLEVEIDLDRVHVPLAPLLTFVHRVLSLSLLCTIAFWLIVLCGLVLVYGTKVERFLEAGREVRVEREVKTAGASGPTSAGARPDAAGT